MIIFLLSAAKSLQLCLTLCDPTDSSPLGSPVLGILQARTLEWVAISFSNAWNWKVKVKSLSHVRLLVTPWTAAYQAPFFCLENTFRLFLFIFLIRIYKQTFIFFSFLYIWNFALLICMYIYLLLRVFYSFGFHHPLNLHV